MRNLSETQLRKIELLKLSGIHDVFKPEIQIISKNDYLQRLEREYQSCIKCKLAKTRHSFVWGQGDGDARVVFIGEGPGEQEDEQGTPFVGKAGQLLTKMLQAIDLSRDEVYITNIVKCRTPQNRNPEEDEIEACLPYLMNQLSIIQPTIICALGKVAANVLLQNDKALGSMRQQFYSFQESKLMVTYHPSALLRNQQWKRPAWEDLKMLRQELQST